MDFNEVIRNKVIDEQKLKKMIAVWRMGGKKIVFTNGCFDMLHHGHIHLLNQARSFGDFLVVGLNTDASVSRIKPGRPVQNEQSRSELIASLEVVDAVILFNDETPERIIEIIQPDVLVKGSDYKPEDVKGKETVEAGGGKVELVQLVEGFSTSALIDKIQKMKVRD